MSEPYEPDGTSLPQPPMDMSWPGAWSAPAEPPQPGPPRRNHSRLMAGAAILVGGGMLAGLVVGYGVWRPSGTLTGSQQASSGTAGSSTGSSTGTGGVVTAGASVTGGVVDIYTTLAYQGAQAAGTGIVLTSNGEVLTNNHVITGATTITAIDIGNGRRYPATVVGYDRTGDLAVLQLTGASGLQVAPLGDSSKLAVGDAVVGVGNAGGAGGLPSQASGYVTALGQSITASDVGGGNPEQLSGLVQVDAAIQAGDSGGPLVDSAGRVVGVDTAASMSTSFRSSGSVGYAIPINEALAVAQQIENGQGSSTVHIGQTAFLGVEILPASFGGAESSQLGTSSGALVAQVVPGTAAAAVGLLPGDLITSVDGSTIASSSDLSAAMAGLHPRQTVHLQWTDQSGGTHSGGAQLTSGPAD
jgi:S1-C subfamily serine protease